jgi:hypothetical protein
MDWLIRLICFFEVIAQPRGIGLPFTMNNIVWGVEPAPPYQRRKSEKTYLTTLLTGHPNSLLSGLQACP